MRIGFGREFAEEDDHAGEEYVPAEGGVNVKSASLAIPAATVVLSTGSLRYKKSHGHAVHQASLCPATAKLVF